MFRKADAEWNGNLQQGKGHVKSGSGAVDGAYDFKSRFESGPATNPEELIAAAHAACFSMALSNILAGAGHAPTSVKTTAKVHLEKQGEGFAIPRIELETTARVPGLSNEEFQKHANAAKTGCPVSKALSATPITLNAKLV